jgi:hypothetical protein
MGELAESVLLTRSGVTQLLDRMITAGLVVREACQGDRIGYCAVVTQLGLETIEKVGPDHSKDVWESFLACDSRGNGSNGDGVQPGIGCRQKPVERQPRLAKDRDRTRPEPTGKVSLSKRN